MTSATCTVNGLSTVGGVDVADDLGTVTIQLVDLAAEEWSISVVGTDDLVATPALSINYTTKTATFTKPAGPWTLILRSQVDNGKDINGKTQPTYTATFKITVLASGALRLLASNERAEGSASFGWITVFNALVRICAAALSSVTGNDVWQSGPDSAYTITGTSGTQVVALPASFTAPHIYKMPLAPGDGMKAGVYDGRRILVNSGNTLTLTTNGGTDHFWVGGVDKGTSYIVDASLFLGGTCMFRRRASDSAWHLA